MGSKLHGRVSMMILILYGSHWEEVVAHRGTKAKAHLWVLLTKHVHEWIFRDT